TKCYEEGLSTFRKLVDNLASGKTTGRKQESSGRQYFAKAKRPENAAILDWRKSAEELYALVRALDFGGYDNPLGHPKCVIGGDVFVVSEATPADVSGSPGTVIEAANDSLVVACQSGGLRMRVEARVDGVQVDSLDVKPGDHLPLLDSAMSEAVNEVVGQVSRHESYWVDALVGWKPLQLPYDTGAAPSGRPLQSLPLEHAKIKDAAASLGIEDAVDLFGAFLSLVFSKLTSSDFTIGIVPNVPSPLNLVAGTVPWNVSVGAEKSISDAAASLAQSLAAVRGRESYLLDLPSRFPETRDLPLASYRVSLQAESAAHHRTLPSVLNISVSADATESTWQFDDAAITSDNVARVQSQLRVLLDALVANPAADLDALSLLTAEESTTLIHDWNDTGIDVPEFCVHQLIEQVVDRRPDAVALVHRGRSLTYREMDERANMLAAELIEKGVESETLVGIYIDRSIEMVLSCLAVMKAGGAYVPLDPEFPRDRIAFMVEDAEIEHVLTVSGLLEDLPAEVETVILADEMLASGSDAQERPRANVDPANLCYVIYTSGSTGRPKGVQLEHRNVANFFVGMDGRIEHEDPGVWLAVTSLSFDISVLELFWTLARGFEVVIFDGVDASATEPTVNKPIDFSLFFFASGEGGDESADKYRLLMDAARYGDQNGFVAVWTPERHFHAFGGLYPNPSVASAAIAAITDNVRIRAGSCVSPLHTPIRIAEEWAVVDNLSRGRVGISFASGWQPDDFVLMPDNFADRKALMFHQIEEVRELWRGGSVRYTNGKGKEIDVRTLPRPVQDDLPVWITAAGSPDTFRMAGERGYNILTHLLGQSKEELADKIEVYRKARAENGY
ncbi:MAG: LLM class flavin-dependent oxidoreductase, partial [Rhodothermales bacterium]|nr:LLM class flavin-dependent oxidoreductase [Rhodothermales bacterium]